MQPLTLTPLAQAGWISQGFESPVSPGQDATAEFPAPTGPRSRLQAGISIENVSERVNHGSSNITREIDRHVTPPIQIDAADRLAELARSEATPYCASAIRRQV